MRVCAVIVLLAAVLAVVDRAAAGEYEQLGAFERREADLVLAAQKRVVDPAPAGKTIGKIVVANREVFGPDDGFLAWFNHFHMVTTRNTIDREVLLRPGMTWDQDLADESIRRVRDPILSNVVILLPIVTDNPNVIDLLVITRDVWSLRFNSNFQLQGQTITLLQLSLAENNFLGWRKHMALTFTLNQGAWSLGPRYTDPNFAGSRLRLSAAADAIFSRADGAFEGSRSSLGLVYPLWSLATHWGASLKVSHYDSVIRSFYGTGLRTYDIPETFEQETLPFSYRYRSVDVSTSLVYSFGDAYKQHVSAGYEFSTTDASFLDSFSADPRHRAAFKRDVFPREELSSAIWASWRVFTPNYETYRDFRTYELREDYVLGPDFSYTVTQALRALGSDRNFTALGASLEVALDPGRHSYLKFGAGWGGRIQDRALIDQRLQFSLYGATPKLWSALRIIGRARLDLRLDESANRFFTLGGDTGLRGHEIGEFDGTRRLRLNLEARSMPLRWAFFRLGFVAFYDVGHAADSFADLSLRHDLGVGLRLLIPQLNPYVLRVDWAFRTDGEPDNFPGRISAGFFQAF